MHYKTQHLIIKYTRMEVLGRHSIFLSKTVFLQISEHFGRTESTQNGGLATYVRLSHCMIFGSGTRSASTQGVPVSFWLVHRSLLVISSSGGCRKFKWSSKRDWPRWRRQTVQTQKRQPETVAHGVVRHALVDEKCGKRAFRGWCDTDMR